MHREEGRGGDREGGGEREDEREGERKDGACFNEAAAEGLR